MGKRKSAKQQSKRSKFFLPTEFNCPKCDFQRCVDVKL